MVAGEVSGDILGGNLLAALKSIVQDVEVSGIAGEHLIAEGATSLFNMQRLSIMGLWEPVCRLPELIKMRRSLAQYFINSPPQLFIGIDAPDFNLGLEQILAKHQIPIVHYVSPSVWAWRSYRIHKIKITVNLMLTLFPFEEEFYRKHQVPVSFVGHPFADQIPMEIDTKSAKLNLGFSSDQILVALMPGSRNNEIKYHAEIYLRTAELMYKKNHHLSFIVPLVCQEHANIIDLLIKKMGLTFPIKIIVQNTRAAIGASDVVLVTSGTATLEVMLHKKPMVVAYKMHPITYALAKMIVKIPYISLPNLLSQELIVPEFIQSNASIHTLAQALFQQLENTSNIVSKFKVLHEQLKQNASFKAANAILKHLT